MSSRCGAEENGRRTRVAGLRRMDPLPILVNEAGLDREEVSPVESVIGEPD